MLTLIITLIRAPMLFSAPDQEPMSYGLNCINDDEVHELDTYLETRLRTLDRSKLSNTNNDDEKIRNVLDVLEALWTIQGYHYYHYHYYHFLLLSLLSLLS